MYNLIINTASEVLSKSAVGFMKFALSLRVHSPNVESQKQMGLEALRSSNSEPDFAEVEENFVDFNGDILFTEELLTSKLFSLEKYSSSAKYLD